MFWTRLLELLKRGKRKRPAPAPDAPLAEWLTYARDYPREAAALVCRMEQNATDLLMNLLREDVPNEVTWAAMDALARIGDPVTTSWTGTYRGRGEKCGLRALRARSPAGWVGSIISSAGW